MGGIDVGQEYYQGTRWNEHERAPSPAVLELSSAQPRREGPRGEDTPQRVTQLSGEREPAAPSELIQQL